MRFLNFKKFFYQLGLNFDGEVLPNVTIKGAGGRTIGIDEGFGVMTPNGLVTGSIAIGNATLKNSPGGRKQVQNFQEFQQWVQEGGRSAQKYQIVELDDQGSVKDAPEDQNIQDVSLQQGNAQDEYAQQLEAITSNLQQEITGLYSIKESESDKVKRLAQYYLYRSKNFEDMKNTPGLSSVELELVRTAEANVKLAIADVFNAITADRIKRGSYDDPFSVEEEMLHAENLMIQHYGKNGVPSSYKAIYSIYKRLLSLQDKNTDPESNLDFYIEQLESEIMSLNDDIRKCIKLGVSNTALDLLIKAARKGEEDIVSLAKLAKNKEISLGSYIKSREEDYLENSLSIDNLMESALDESDLVIDLKEFEFGKIQVDETNVDSVIEYLTSKENKTKEEEDRLLFLKGFHIQSLMNNIFENHIKPLGFSKEDFLDALKLSGLFEITHTDDVDDPKITFKQNAPRGLKNIQKLSRYLKRKFYLDISASGPNEFLKHELFMSHLMRHANEDLARSFFEIQNLAQPVEKRKRQIFLRSGDIDSEGKLNNFLLSSGLKDAYNIEDNEKRKEAVKSAIEKLKSTDLSPWQQEIIKLAEKDLSLNNYPTNPSRSDLALSPTQQEASNNIDYLATAVYLITSTSDFISNEFNYKYDIFDKMKKAGTFISPDKRQQMTYFLFHYGGSTGAYLDKEDGHIKLEQNIKDVLEKELSDEEKQIYDQLDDTNKTLMLLDHFDRNIESVELSGTHVSSAKMANITGDTLVVPTNKDFSDYETIKQNLEGDVPFESPRGYMFGHLTSVVSVLNSKDLELDRDQAIRKINLELFDQLSEYYQLENGVPEPLQDFLNDYYRGFSAGGAKLGQYSEGLLLVELALSLGGDDFDYRAEEGLDIIVVRKENKTFHIVVNKDANQGFGDAILFKLNDDESSVESSSAIELKYSERKKFKGGKNYQIPQVASLGYASRVFDYYKNTYNSGVKLPYNNIITLNADKEGTVISHSGLVGYVSHFLSSVTADGGRVFQGQFKDG